MTDRKLDFTLVSVNPTSHTDEDLKKNPPLDKTHFTKREDQRRR